MTDATVKETARPGSSAPDSPRRPVKPARAADGKTPAEKIRVFVAAENRLLRETLARVLSKGGGIEVIATNSAAPFHTDALLETCPDILLLNSRGNLEEDLRRMSGQVSSNASVCNGASEVDR